MCARACAHVCAGRGRCGEEGLLFFPSTPGPGAMPCARLMAFSLISTVKKKCSVGIMGHLMSLGRKKSTSLEPAERSLETACKQRSRLMGRRA